MSETVTVVAEEQVVVVTERPDASVVSVVTAGPQGPPSGTAVTVAKSGTANILTSSYANDAAAIIAAVSLASTLGTRRVLVLGDNTTTYTIGNSRIDFPSNFIFEAQPGVLFKLRNNTSGTNPVGFGNSDTVNGNANIYLRNITGDGNGANQVAGQSSGGVFFNFSGVQNLVYDNVNIYDSIRYNSFIGVASSAAITGTATFTIDSPTITGSGTSFTSLTVGKRLRSASGNLTPPIAKINSDTSLTLATPWPHATESGVSASSAQGVTFLVKDSKFGRTYEDDTFGGGGWDYPKIDNCTFENASGYGFGSTGMFGGTITNVYAHHNLNGLGLERVSNSTFTNVITEYNSSKGVNLINGSHSNRFVSVIARYNADGFYDANTSATKGQNARNSYTSCLAEFNTNNGFNICGVDRPSFFNCVARSNSTASAGTYYGFVFQAANNYNTTRPVIRSCRGFDDQVSQTQTKDIHFTAGATNARVDFTGFDNISGLSAPNYSANMQILGGGKQISIITAGARAISNYENYILCNQDSFAHTLPRLDSIVDGHKVKYLYNGAGTPTWTFARSPSDSFGTLEDYSAIPQDGHFWIEWCWDNSTKRWFISGTNHAAGLNNKVDKVVGKGLSTEDYSTAEKTKLAGIATGATANDSDANLKSRANHTGSQAISTVTGLQTALDGKLPVSGVNSGDVFLDYIGGKTSSNFTFDVNGNFLGTLSVGGVGVVLLTGAQTLASKTLTAPVINGVRFGIATKTANYTLNSGDHTCLVNAASGPITITLPNASVGTGQSYVIKKIDSSGNAVTVATTSSQTIDGATTQSLASQWTTIRVRSNGSSWFIV
ncbi:hypothetical protein QM806_04405 [Rhodococcus sp. IEGM 1351]|uniref:hypothetical protein n=1 Tax=Rhodococcus sp. IEGM 1351 TaxID=3047089 RepID=UPI0024B74FB4|nr:hypothetical protein [Rhodococcus sp. IEGM 1351]MDI9934696.1 hypothetical protein [Rhodococcus sp. IEGM 1351]